MLPILYKCGFVTVYTYGVFVALAFFVTTSLLSFDAKKRHLDENALYNLCIVVLLCGIIFARIFYVALNWDFFKENPVEIIQLQHGGLVWFGGLIGALGCALIYLRIKKMPLLETMDFMVPYIALGQSIGRIGCFFNGCCYGKETTTWGIYFPVHGQILFPSQILDSLTLLLIYFLLKAVSQGRAKGIIFSLYLVLAGLQRFLMELLRGDQRPFYFGLSIFQWISTGLFVAGLILYLKFTWKKKTV